MVKKQSIQTKSIKKYKKNWKDASYTIPKTKKKIIDHGPDKILNPTGLAGSTSQGSTRNPINSSGETENQAAKVGSKTDKANQAIWNKISGKS